MWLSMYVEGPVVTVKWVGFQWNTYYAEVGIVEASV